MMPMKIIRDEEGHGLFMIPLLVEWGIKCCNVVDCKSQPNTIIAGMENAPMFGLCEEHFQQGNVSGGTTLELEWEGE